MRFGFLAVDTVRSAQQQTPPATYIGTDLRAYWPLWLVVAAGVFLRIYDIHRLPGMHGDEAWYGLQARRLLAGEAVAWRTPTGNVPGLLQLWSLILLHAIFPPSLILLRVPAVISSIGAMMVAYVAGRRFFGPTAAMAAVSLMASLPINIAYARLGWDPSHTPILILASACAAFAGRMILCALLFALALANHPSAVFAAPFLLFGFLGFRLEQRLGRQSLVEALKLTALLIGGILLSITFSPATIHYVSISGAISRLVDLDGWVRFGLLFCRLLSGDTIYIYSGGSSLGSLRLWFDWALAASFALLAGAALLSMRRRVDWSVAGMFLGFAASIALLYLAAGAWVLQPKFERFAYPLVPIAALMVAVLIEKAMAGKRWLLSLFTAFSISMLVTFWLHYVTPLTKGNVASARGFWTGEHDPALSAYRLIAADASRPTRARIIAEDWWLHMPISYYAVGGPFELVDARRLRPYERFSATGETYWVTFGGSELDQALARRSDVTLRWTIYATGQSSKVRIWKQPAG